ncbi:nucleoside hydrolase [Granulicella sp. dw_53]|uniref:nucleoside hydrolase n=1 Tax=Granulicella sp. dw_53 TaxID=2719792 RepID=UPI001BD3B942
MSTKVNEKVVHARTPVVLIHDAAIDEFISTMLLIAMPEIDLLGIVIVNADCLEAPALQAASKLQQFLRRPEIPIALSRARGWNAFPWEYRGDCVTFGEIPSLQPFTPYVVTPPPDGEVLLATLLKQAIAGNSPLTLLMTGPMTPLTDVLRLEPELIEGVEKIVWMGGAIDVPGNLDPATLNPAVANAHAEWNAFWDPYSVDEVLLGFSGIHLFPLDISNSAPVSKAFLDALQKQGKTYSYSQLAFEAYSLVVNEPFYRLWDVTAACWLTRPGFYTPSTKMHLAIETWGFNQGWIRRVPDRVETSVNLQNVFLSFTDQPGFYQYVLDLLATSGTP